MSDAHPLDWYPEPDDDPKGVPVAVVERWVNETLAYEDDRDMQRANETARSLWNLKSELLDLRLRNAKRRGQGDSKSSRLYYVRCVECSLIKIGTSRDIWKRFDEIQRTGHILDILGVDQGGRREEIEIHERFWMDRAEGEWFRPSEDLIQYIRTWVDRPDYSTAPRHWRRR